MCVGCFLALFNVSTSQTVENLCGENCLFGGPIKFLFKLFFFGFFSEKEIRYDDGGAAACENGDELINNSDGYYLGWFSLFCGVCIRIVLAEPIIKFLNKIKNFDPTSSIKNAYTVVIPKEVDFSHLARNLGYSGKLVLHRSGNCSALIALFCFIFSKIIGLTSQIFIVPIF